MRTVPLGSSSTRVAHIVAGMVRIDRMSDDDVARLRRAARDAVIDFFDHVGGAGDEHVDSGSGVGGGVGCGSRVVVGGEQSVAGSRCHIATLTGYGAAVFAIAHDGDVWAWGRNWGPMLGIGSTDDQFSPAKVGGLSRIRKVTASARVGYALSVDNALWAWGEVNHSGIGITRTPDWPHRPGPSATSSGRGKSTILRSSPSPRRPRDTVTSLRAFSTR